MAIRKTVAMAPSVLPHVRTETIRVLPQITHAIERVGFHES